MNDRCPNCGTDNVYNHDKGFQYFVRLLQINSRIVCKECSTTWRRGSPHRFSKLKHKKRRKTKLNTEYVRKDWAEVETLDTVEKIDQCISKWQTEETIFICLNFDTIQTLTELHRNLLVKISRKLKAISGNLIIDKARETVYQELWSLNLGFLVANNQKIKSE